MSEQLYWTWWDIAYNSESMMESLDEISQDIGN